MNYDEVRSMFYISVIILLPLFLPLGTLLAQKQDLTAIISMGRGSFIKATTVHITQLST